ncbi:uncharacterized protein CTRU02_202426 [Colletotrichum truncatum]|uniref:Uncharacterized protein n=1 Tax=Colletotrichum truncatum TaxID=5467 RepID=A0ACC3ZK86_COLTU|nr:uncharacterized protein CTRU02_01593 [Colletotrichum truncatum]KAF6799914.1 hypothetical protein CTRU02_01593 [Colletotrichum truncatum]
MSLQSRKRHQHPHRAKTQTTIQLCQMATSEVLVHNLSLWAWRLPGITGRSPSTSPPPQPLPESFMIEGLDNDDRYRMVEDELFTIAGQFTAHLHAAEYQRLKAQTRSQNAETIRNISRPVVGSLTELARKRQEELLRKEKQREALRKAKKEAGLEEGSGDETNVSWRGTSLQGLMNSPKKKEVPLMALTRMDTGTKASTLFGGAVKSRNKRPAPTDRRDEDVETEDETDDDDLGGPVRPPVRRELARDPPATARPTQAARPVPQMPLSSTARIHRTVAGTSSNAGMKAASNTRNQPPSTTTPNSSKSKLPTTTESVVKDEDDDDDDLFTRFKNRNARTRQRRDTNTGTKEVKTEGRDHDDVIPSFM